MVDGKGVLNMTTGEILFYGGIFGMAISIILSIAAFFIFKNTGAALKKKLGKEYDL